MDNYIIEINNDITKNYKTIKNILTSEKDKLTNYAIQNSFEKTFVYFQESLKTKKNIKKSIYLIRYYLDYIDSNKIQLIINEINEYYNNYLENKDIVILLKSLLIKCKKQKITYAKSDKIELTQMSNTEKIDDIINKINKENDINKLLLNIKKLAIYIDRIKTEKLSNDFYNELIKKLNIILQNHDNIEPLLKLINKCKRLGNVIDNEFEQILYSCDNNIHDYIYFLNNENNLYEDKDKIMNFITKIGFEKKEFEDIDSLNLKRGFITGLTYNNKDYLLKYQPNKSVMELILNCYLKKMNIKNFLIPDYFFINSDYSYFYIIEKCNTDLYKYFSHLESSREILSIKEIVKIVYFIVQSTEKLHNINIIHSDLKLENIVLNVEQKEIKDIRIIDFDVGVFDILPEYLTNLNEKYNKVLTNKKLRGTRIYMLKDKVMSFKHDIYSIGVITLVLLYKNIKLNLNYIKDIKSKGIIKKLVNFKTKIEDNKVKIKIVDIIDKYIKQKHLLFLDDKYDYDKFNILKEFIGDCIETKFTIQQLKDKYEKILFCI